MGPSNSSRTMGLLPSTDSFNFEEPAVSLDDSDEKRKRRISKSKQWKEIREFLEQRRELYRQQTPGGVLYNNMPKIDASFYSAVGNSVIEEIDQFIAFIEGVM